MNDNTTRAAEVSELLRAYTQRTIRLDDGEGGTYARRPSLRWIEAQMNGDIAHQRLSEFLRNPESVTANMLQRISDVIESPTLEQIWGGDRVTYFDAPAMTEQRIASMQVPTGAVAFRLVIETDEDGYNGFRSSGWSGDLERINEALDAAPGGRNAVTRIVFDTAA